MQENSFEKYDSAKQNFGSFINTFKEQLQNNKTKNNSMNNLCEDILNHSLNYVIILRNNMATLKNKNNQNSSELLKYEIKENKSILSNLGLVLDFLSTKFDKNDPKYQKLLSTVDEILNFQVD